MQLSQLTFVVLVLFSCQLAYCQNGSAEVDDDNVDAVSILSKSQLDELGKKARAIKGMCGFREWKSSTGSTVRAKFAGISEGKIRLRKVGDELSIPMNALSKEDQEFLLNLFAAQYDLLGSAAQVIASTDERVAEANAEVEKLKQQDADKAQLIEELSKELSIFKPGQGLADDGTPVLTAKQIEILGEKYVEKGKVRMLNAKVSSVYTDQTGAPGASAGDGRYYPAVAKEWLNVVLSDQEGELFHEAWAKKADYGEYFALLPKNEHVDVEGYIIRSQNNTEFKLIITKVTKTLQK